MAPRKATTSRATSAYSTHTEGCYEFFDPKSAQGTFKDAEWVKGVSKDEMHDELLKVENENADLQRQIKTYLRELTIANDKIMARDAEISELKGNIATLKKAPITSVSTGASTTCDNSFGLNEKIYSQICDSIESQLAVYKQQFDIVQVKYKALEKYKEAIETKEPKKPSRSQKPKNGKAATKVGEIIGPMTSIQSVDLMESSNNHEIQQPQRENDMESESEQPSTSSEEY